MAQVGLGQLISLSHTSEIVQLTNEPLAMGCTSCARLILSAGRNTMEGMPAAAQYAASAAEVSPVDAHPTACTVFGFSFRSRFTCGAASGGLSGRAQLTQTE
jgi:predicted metal-binding membrane protein